MAYAVPEGLRERAAALWSGTVDGKELEAGELVLLEEACRLVDQIDVMQAALEGQGLVVTGSRGQQVASPLIREIRANKLAVTRILRQLMAAAPVEEEGRRLTASERARKAAVLRHHGPRAASDARQAMASATVLDMWRRESVS